MNELFSIRISPRFRSQRAFTLVELLVVIAIIGLLAGLVVSGAGIASAKMRRARVETERDALITSIDSYKKAKGFYPPDNVTNNVQNQLFYELTGTTASTATPIVFTNINQVTLNANDISTLFLVDGFVNSSTDPSAVQNFYKSLKVNQHADVKSVTGNITYTILGIGVPGPFMLTPVSLGSQPINPWHYSSSNPTNTGEYDLWMDVVWSGKTNRVSNWSKDPQIVSY